MLRRKSGKCNFNHDGIVIITLAAVATTILADIIQSDGLEDIDDESSLKKRL